VRSLGVGLQSIESVLAAASPPVIEGSAGYPSCGAYLADWDPLPTSFGVFMQAHYSLSTHECAICHGITQLVVGLTKLKYLLAHLSCWRRPLMKRELDPPNKSGEYCPARQTHCVRDRAPSSRIDLV
jgi:hypothetical protein